jgi:hypothetical protein
MPKRKLKKMRLSVSVNESQKEALQDMADRSDVSLARVIQEAIKEFLENHPNGRLPLFGRRYPQRPSQKRPPPKG